MDCKMTCSADPSIVGTMMAGCFLQVQNDLPKILSKKTLFTLNEETSLNLPEPPTYSAEAPDSVESKLVSNLT